MPYLLDADTFIQAKNLHYGFDFCPAYWDWIERVNNDHIVYSVEKVKSDLLAGSDELSEWANERGKEFFLPPTKLTLPSLEQISTWVKSSEYESVAINTFLEISDYYLIAQAHETNFTVVTHEKIASSLKRIKIPNVCHSLNIKVMSPFQMLKEERARFVLGNIKGA